MALHVIKLHGLEQNQSTSLLLDEEPERCCAALCLTVSSESSSPGPPFSSSPKSQQVLSCAEMRLVTAHSFLPELGWTLLTLLPSSSLLSLADLPGEGEGVQRTPRRSAPLRNQMLETTVSVQFVPGS
eukprot:2329089-Rhodomonas_salina.2